MNEQQARKHLTKQIELAGSQKEWAASAGISGAYVCDVLQGRRGMGKSILRALGLKMVPTYERIDGGKL